MLHRRRVARRWSVAHVLVLRGHVGLLHHLGLGLLRMAGRVDRRVVGLLLLLPETTSQQAQGDDKRCDSGAGRLNQYGDQGLQGLATYHCHLASLLLLMLLLHPLLGETRHRDASGTCMLPGCHRMANHTGDRSSQGIRGGKESEAMEHAELVVKVDRLGLTRPAFGMAWFCVAAPWYVATPPRPWD